MNNNPSIHNNTNSTFISSQQALPPPSKMSIDSEPHSKDVQFGLDLNQEVKPKNQFFKSLWGKKKTKSYDPPSPNSNDLEFIEPPQLVENYFSITQNQIAFLLKNNICVSYFLISLILDYCPEILLFYLEVETFMNSSETRSDLRKKHASIIYNTFIRRSSPLEINISSSLSQKLAMDIIKDVIPDSIFQKAQVQMFKQLESSLLNFIQKSEHNQMLKIINELNSGSIDPKYANYIAASQISLTLNRAYGVRIQKHSSPKNYVDLFVISEQDLTTPDLRSSLEAWANRFSSIHLGIPLPTIESSTLKPFPSLSNTESSSGISSKGIVSSENAKSTPSISIFSSISFKRPANTATKSAAALETPDQSFNDISPPTPGLTFSKNVSVKNKSDTFLINRIKPNSNLTKWWSRKDS
ncbi:hypothetical protein AYI68_g6369 [Smittium mucronatum]|uniref:RGS domain-containing protein n=1 Tax=Smittium mucronatum TaxID=133383 RepID=A0A1R0GRT9_9FUNG|nr:hypothetical protein AYI68_g6369 [Smittium mucronatum]